MPQWVLAVVVRWDARWPNNRCHCVSEPSRAVLIENPLTPITGVTRFVHQDLQGRNFLLRVTTTRSPFGSSCVSMSRVKSVALMMPSPNFSWMISLMVSP